MTSKAVSQSLIRTMRNLDALTELLDGDLLAAPMPTSRPLKPSQVDKLVRTAFNHILSTLHTLRLELLQKHSNINEIRDYNKLIHERQNRRSKKVIDPKTITVQRSIAVFDKRLEFIQDLFSEVLQAYEKQMGQKWIEPGSVK